MLSRDVANPIGVEGFGISFLEASYMGMPVIAGRSGGTCLPVIHNFNGYLVDPSCRIVAEETSKYVDKLRNDKDLFDQFSRFGKVYAQNFTWSKTCVTMMNYLQLYKFS